MSLENKDRIVTKLAFTICSNNYLAHAKTWIDSLYKHNPDFRIVLGLVDRKSNEIDYSFFEPGIVLELNENIIPGYEDMISRYGIIELNTAVKPFFFQYLFKEHSEVEFIYYFDPDIKIYSDLEDMNALFNDHSILLTPHFYTPLPLDEYLPFENMALNYGIYNLGFLGLKAQSDEVQKLLKWWGERTYLFGYSRLAEGLFVDQLWINLVPGFFKDVFIVQHPGCNMAPWNLHERTVKDYITEEDIILCDDSKLIFFHFSSFDFRKPDQLTKYHTRYTFAKMPELKKLYRDYYNNLVENRVLNFAKFKCALPIVDYTPRLKHKIALPVIKLLTRIWKKI